MRSTGKWTVGIATLVLCLAWGTWARRRRMGDASPDSAPANHPDPVDEAIAESFPASDPPSWAGQ